MFKNMITRKYRLVSVATLLPVLLFSQHNKPAPDYRPNIILLLADDLGYGELGCYGQGIIETPNIDKLAEKGMKFTGFYAGNAVCAPSRAVLMTGRHPGHSSVRGNSGVFENDIWDRVALRKDEITLGEMMKNSGYQTAYIGKWHLDDPNDESTWAFSRGFDYAVQEQWSSLFGGKKFDPLLHWVNIREDSVRYDPKEYDCIDEFRTNLALDYLNKKEPSRPYFLVMSYRIPHGNEYQIRNQSLYADRGWPETERRHAAKITLLDTQVGRLLQRLEETGELSNTVILFTSDNGAHHEGGHDHKFFNSSGNLRGYKRDLYEGGIRVPLIVYWQDRIQAGYVTDHTGAFQDIMPTLAEITQSRVPENIDGISFLPTLTGKKQQEHKYLYWEIQLDGWWQELPTGGFRQAVRMGNWKGIRYSIDQPTELYDLVKDEAERTDVSKSHPEIVNKINQLFHTARTEHERFPYGGKIQNYKASEKFR
jgi:arylsulfatase A-like enzyme